MLLQSVLLLAASMAVNAAKVTFINQDDVPRTLIFTPSVANGHPYLPDLNVAPYQTVSMDFPWDWEGNWYAITQGAPRETGMLGEVKFAGFDGITFFDVSGIVNAEDHHNVKKMYPAHSKEPQSGCDVFWCANVYWHSEDKQTQATRENHLITTLGDRPQDRLDASRSIGNKFSKSARAEQVEETKQE
ncbi:hypothetical protein QBC43DRAFT_327360 [Cladorrhinum sp. PSN259]|nr:hypothetical protein QBC43DRAFT_327360 [Cladorrhinum sp. PSN259]